MISRTVNSILLFSILYTLNKTLATEILMVFIISGLALLVIVFIMYIQFKIEKKNKKKTKNQHLILLIL